MLRKLALVSAIALWVAGCAAISLSAADKSTVTSPEFRQVFDLIRENLPGVSEAELNRAATEGLVAKLSPRVALVGSNDTTVAVSAALTRSNLFESGVLYLRIAIVDPSLERSVKAAWEVFSMSNKLAGVILDLRYACGEDYPSAAAVARLFLQTKQPLLDWGDGMVESKDGGAIGSCPVVTLVNRETSGAAEALAAVLRVSGRGLILGKSTAGKAGAAKLFPLENGDFVRIITRPIRLGDGSQMSATGVIPDIGVDVNPTDESNYYADPFAASRVSNQAATSGATGFRTNQPVRRPRYGEAELVRDRRQGLTADAPVADPRAEPEVPQLQDVTLLRALDLLKGLAIVRQTRS
jgi:hypothetical protein